MFYLKTTILIFYIVLGLYPLSLMLAAAVGSYPQIFTISCIYALFWFILGGAALIRPEKCIKYFVVVILVAFFYMSYKVIPDAYIILLHLLKKGPIKPGTRLYYTAEATVYPLWFLAGLLLEGILSYLLFKKSVVKDRRPNTLLKRDENII